MLRRLRAEKQRYFIGKERREALSLLMGGYERHRRANRRSLSNTTVRITLTEEEWDLVSAASKQMNFKPSRLLSALLSNHLSQI